MNGVTTTMTTNGSTNYAAPSQVSTINLSSNLNYTSFLGLSSASGPNGDSASIVYDGNARPQSTTSPTGAVTNFTYNDTVSPPSKVATTNGHWVKTSTDGFGRTIKVETGYGATTVSTVETVYGPCGCSPLRKMMKQSQPYVPGSGRMRRRHFILMPIMTALQSCGERRNPDLLSELSAKSRREGLGLAEAGGKTVAIHYFDSTGETREIPGARDWTFCSPQMLVGQTPSGLLFANLKGTLLARSSVNLYVLPVALSPDGKLIAFIGKNRDENGDMGLQYGLLNSRTFHMIDRSVDTGEDPNRPYGTVSWSADGRSITYARDGHVYIYDLGKDQSRVLTEGTNPTWSPEGTWIAYKSPKEEPAIIRPDGSETRTLVARKIVYAVHWSPDGDYVAFQERLFASGQIVVFRVRDGARTALAEWAYAPTDVYLSWIKTGPR